MNNLPTKFEQKFVPIAQKLLKLEYKKYSVEQLEKILGCDEITKLENDKLRSELKPMYEKFIEEHILFSFNKNRLKKKGYKYFREYEDGFEFYKENAFSYNIPKKVCKIDFEKVNEYSQSTIPDFVLNKMDELVNSGSDFDNFYIGYPIVEDRKLINHDPLLLFKSNDEYFLIEKWN